MANKQSEQFEVQGIYKRLRAYLRKNGKIRNIQAAELLGVKKNESRGDLAKLAEIGILVPVSDANEVVWYFSNEENFYSNSKDLISNEENFYSNSKDLIELMPQSEVLRITDLIGDKSRSISSLSRMLYGDPRGERGDHFIVAVLEYFMGQGLVKQKQGWYSLSLSATNLALMLRASRHSRRTHSRTS